MVQVVDDVIRAHQMKPTQSGTKGNTQGTVLRHCPTLYSPSGIYPKSVSNTYYVFSDYPHLSLTRYVRLHLEGHELAELWDLHILLIDVTAREMFQDWRQILTQTTM